MFLRTLSMACLCTLATQPAFAHGGHSSGGVEGSGPINTTQAATMAKGDLTVGLNTEYVQFDRFSDAELIALAGDHVHAHGSDWMSVTTLGVSYGIQDNLSLNLSLPYIYRDNIRAGEHSHSHGSAINTAESLGDSGGLGDITALGQYRFWNQGVNQAAVLFGAKLPTGRTDVTNVGELLETENQPGSGSWDGLLGLAAGTKVGGFAIDASILYTFATEGSQNTDLGDRFQYNLAASYRVDGDSVYQGSAFDLVLELNGEWTDEKELDDETDEDSGGNTVFLSPGVRFVPNKQWSGQLSVGIPVISDMGDGHPDAYYKVMAGVVRSF